MCRLQELQELQREAEALKLKTEESEALITRTGACRKWTTRIHNELLRRKSSRKADGAKLSCADVEALLLAWHETEERVLDALEGGMAAASPAAVSVRHASVVSLAALGSQL